MAASVSPTQTSAAGSSRRRGGGNTKEATTEDQALNMIAREAEARLAAKRAARAEARSIRMKEIERKQKEADEEVASEDNDPEDYTSNMYIKRPFNDSKPPKMSTPTTSPSFDTQDSSPCLSPTTEMQIQQLKEAARVSDVRYKKAMVNSAQLDNEKQALQYQVEILKDIIEEIQQKVENTEEELTHKVREYGKLNREHNNTSSELKKCVFLLEDRERILDENGINIDGSMKEGYSPPVTAEEDSTCRRCSSSMDDTGDHRERGSLLAEIASLKTEVVNLRRENESDSSRREAEHMKTEQRVDLERSFADVSNEAAVIREDARHTGLYVNNNENCDEFEVINDGSQEGGIRNFEDKSYEGSTSITSSMMTDVTASTESEIPFEISVGHIAKPEQKDDYDIVHVEDTNKPTNLHVDSYTSGSPHQFSSPANVSSNININKYLFFDQDDTINDDTEHATGTFSVDRYFAFESSSNEINMSGIVAKDNDELHNSVDTIKNVQSDYDNINTEDVPTPNMQSRLSADDSPESPYEDLQEESADLSRHQSRGMVVIEGSSNTALSSFDQNSIEPGDIKASKSVDVSVDKSVMQTHADKAFVSTDVAKLPEVCSVPTVKSSSSSKKKSTKQSHTITVEKTNHIVTVEKTAHKITVEKSSAHTITVEPSPNTNAIPAMKSGKIPVTSGNIAVTSKNKSSKSKNVTVKEEFVSKINVQTEESANTESIVVGDKVLSKNKHIDTTDDTSDDSTMNTAFFYEGSSEEPVAKKSSDTETDKIAMRHDLEELYNQIAGETEPVETADMSDLSEPPTPTNEAEKKASLVHVATFDTAQINQINTPEIQVLDTDPRKNVETNPEPKERKKKKKKHKGEKTEKVVVTELPGPAQITVVPSDPLLLGYENENERDGSSTPPSPTVTDNSDSRKNDIPKQFLDASHDLGDNSCSDLSDIDEELGEDGLKKKSSKRSKKEGCKSQ